MGYSFSFFERISHKMPEIFLIIALNLLAVGILGIWIHKIYKNNIRELKENHRIRIEKLIEKAKESSRVMYEHGWNDALSGKPFRRS